jgi:hypothetical protein
MKMGGLRHTKWVSNNRAVLDAILDYEFTPIIVSLSPEYELLYDRVLGIKWNVDEDFIIFKTKKTNTHLTRRGMFSIVRYLIKDF